MQMCSTEIHHHENLSETSTPTFSIDLYELLYDKLLDMGQSATGTRALAELLQGIVGRLVRGLCGPNRDAALETLWTNAAFFQCATRALQLAIDKQAVQTQQLENIHKQFEQQLTAVGRFCARPENKDTTSFLDRVTVKDLLHQLLGTVDTVLRLESEYGQTQATAA